MPLKAGLKAFFAKAGRSIRYAQRQRGRVAQSDLKRASYWRKSPGVDALKTLSQTESARKHISKRVIKHATLVNKMNNKQTRALNTLRKAGTPAGITIAAAGTGYALQRHRKKGS